MTTICKGILLKFEPCLRLFLDSSLSLLTPQYMKSVGQGGGLVQTVFVCNY